MSGIAEIGIRVFLDNVASGGLVQLAQQLNQIQTSSNAASAGLRAMQEATLAGAFVGFGAVLLGVGAAVKYSVSAAEEFQTALFNMAVATHVSYSEAAKYTQALMTLGATSTFTTADIVTGIAALGRSGYSLHEILDTLGKDIPTMAASAIMMSIAIGTDAVSGFKVLAQVMSAYHTPAVEAIKTANLIQFAFEHQRGSVADFATGLSQVTPDAAKFHISLRDVGAALDVISSGMSSTSRAGTALRYLIDGLYTPTNAAQKVMVALGLAAVDSSGNFHSAFYDSKGMPLEFGMAVDILKQKLAGMSEEARNTALRELFSTRGGQGVAVLLGQLDKYNAYIHQLKGNLDNAGMVQQRFAEKMQLLAPQLSALSTSFKDLGVAIGLAIIPAITEFIRWLNTAVSGIRSFAIAHQAAIPMILAMSGAIAAIGLAITGMMLVMANPAIAAFGLTLLAASGGSLALGIALSGLLNWVRSLHLNMGEVNRVLGVARGVLLGVAGAVAGVPIAMLVPWFIRLVPAIAAVVSGLGPFLSMLFSVGGQMVLGFVRFGLFNGGLINVAMSLGRAALAALPLVGSFLAMGAPIIIIVAAVALAAVGLGILIARMGGMNAIVGAARAIWNTLQPILSQAAREIGGALKDAVTQLQPAWQQLTAAFQAARPVIMLLGAVLGVVLLAALSLVLGFLVGLIKAVAAFVVGLIHVFAGIAQVLAGVITFFLGFFTLLHGLFTHNNAEISAGWNNMWRGLATIVQGIGNTIKAVIVTVFTTIGAFFSGWISSTIAFFQHLANVLVGHSIIPDMMNAIRQVIMSVLTAVSSFIMGILNGIIAFFTSAGARISAVVTAAFNIIRVIVSLVMIGINALIHGNLALAQAAFQAAGSVITSVMQNAMNNLRNAVSSGINTAMTFFSGLPGRIQGALSGLAGMLFSSGANAMQQFANGLGSAIGAVVSQVQAAAGQVANFLAHHSPAKMGPLSDDDKWMGNMMGMFANDIKRHTPLVTDAAQNMAGNIAGVPSMARSSASQGQSTTGNQGGGMTTVNLVLDGRVVDQVVMNRLTGSLQMNGLGRIMR